MIKHYWVSSKFATAYVEVADNKIIDTAPIFKKFIDQDFNNLINWLRSRAQDPSEVIYEEIKN